MSPGVPLTVVCEPPSRAADLVRSAWDRHQPVLVLDPRAPVGERDRQMAVLKPDEGAGGDVAAIVCTSGTTGEPRGVELTWTGLEAAALASSKALGAGGADRWLCCLPLHHVAGLSIVARSWLTGVPVTVLDRFDPSEVTAASASTTMVSLVPTMARRLLDAGHDPADLFRVVLLGGAPVPPDLRGVRGYGLTESWGGVVYDGRAVGATEVRIGADNEVLLRGPTVMKGYRFDAEATAAAFTRADDDGDRSRTDDAGDAADTARDWGWLRTGDAGGLDSDGRLYIVDRLRDLIISGGVNVSPTEVEQVLARHPGVADVCVVGRPDPEWGEVVVAYVVVADLPVANPPARPVSPPTLAALRSFAADRLSTAKLPRLLVLVDAIPRNPAGKPLRRLLDPPPASPSRSSV